VSADALIPPFTILFNTYAAAKLLFAVTGLCRWLAAYTATSFLITQIALQCLCRTMNSPGWVSCWGTLPPARYWVWHQMIQLDAYTSKLNLHLNMHSAQPRLTSRGESSYPSAQHQSTGIQGPSAQASTEQGATALAHNSPLTDHAIPCQPCHTAAPGASGCVKRAPSCRTCAVTASAGCGRGTRQHLASSVVSAGGCQALEAQIDRRKKRWRSAPPASRRPRLSELRRLISCRARSQPAPSRRSSSARLQRVPRVRRQASRS